MRNGTLTLGHPIFHENVKWKNKRRTGKHQQIIVVVWSFSRVQLFATPLSVLHCLQEFAQTHIRWVNDAIQPSHPLSSSSPPALNLSPNWSFQMSQLFASGGQSIGLSASTSDLPMNIQDWSPLGWTGWISLQFKGLSRVFPTPQFKSINFLALSFVHSPTLTSVHDHWKNHSLD